MKDLLAKILALPRRAEPLGGQSYTYVRLEDVTGLFEERGIFTRTRCTHKFVASPICGNPHYCPKCGAEEFMCDD